MADRSVEELLKFVAGNPQIPWADFSCTPVLEFDADGKALTTARRCAVTAGGTTVVVHMPHRITIGKGQPWPPKAIIDGMMEAVGPVASG